MESRVLERKAHIATLLQVAVLAALLSGLAVGVKSYVGDFGQVPHLEQPQRLS